MIESLRQIWDFNVWALIAPMSAAVALTSIVADRRRQRRDRLDQVGFMPWTGITVGAVLVTLVTLALAIKAS
jgi:hypothetical protein